jgi:hypothetical protein
MKHVFLAFIALSLSSCGDLVGKVPLDPTIAIKQDTVPCIDSYWTDCTKLVGEDYNIGYSPSLEDYGLLYTRNGIQFVFILNHDGTVKTLQIGIGDFVDLGTETGLIVVTNTTSPITISKEEMERKNYVLQNREILVRIFNLEFEDKEDNSENF